jgi:putative sigma-54 modulation protein
MQIQAGHHVEINTESLRNYVETQIRKLERHFEHNNNVHVNFQRRKLKQKYIAKLCT